MQITVKNNNNKFNVYDVKDTLYLIVISLLLFKKHIYKHKRKFLILKSKRFRIMSIHTMLSTQTVSISYINNTLILVAKNYYKPITNKSNRTRVTYQKIIISASNTELLNLITLLKLNPCTFKNTINTYIPRKKLIINQADTFDYYSYVTDCFYYSYENISKQFILNANNKLHFNPIYSAKYKLKTNS